MNSNPIQPVSTGHIAQTYDWRAIGRIAIKAALLFLALNLLFAACRPLDSLGSLSLYNSIFPGRSRLPYGEVPAEDYNLTLNNLTAMFASHEWTKPVESNEYRVLLIGDSATWGWFLENDDTLAGQLNALDLVSADGRQVTVYNLGYPVMSLTKDLMVLDMALQIATPDLILWPVTLQSFARQRQLDHPLLHQNPQRIRDLISRYDLDLDPTDPRLVDRSLWEETIAGHRRDLADLFRLQAWGLAWAATGHDQSIPDEIPQRKTDFEADESWMDLAAPRPLTSNDLAFEVLSAGTVRADSIPMLIVNEPIYVSDGENSDIRYNAYYPRWAYDQYRTIMADSAAASSWHYLDLWDAVPSAEFTDTPVHMTPAGNRMLAGILAKYITGSAD